MVSTHKGVLQTRPPSMFSWRAIEGSYICQPLLMFVVVAVSKTSASGNAPT